MKHLRNYTATPWIIVLLLTACALQMMAQGRKKKKAAPETQTFMMSDSMPRQVQPAEVQLENRYFNFPQFYTYWPINVNDTVLKYECFDAGQHPINTDTLKDANDVKFISLTRTYTDFVNTYVDSQGKVRPVAVSRLLYRYDRTGADSWRSFDYTSNYVAELKEYKDEIMKADTTLLVDPVTGTRQFTIRRYYRVVEIARRDSAQTPDSTAAQGPAPDSLHKRIQAAYSYYVPEFYFHLPKKNKDTVLEFRAYDSRDSLVPAPENFDSVFYFSLYKTYTDSAHTYLDSNGVKQLLPVSSIIQRYDRIGRNKWMSIEYPGNKYTEFTEYKSSISSSDTESYTDPSTNGLILKIYNHYRVIK